MRIIPRQEWKALPNKYKPTPHIPNKITVHHQGGTENNPLMRQHPMWRGPETVRSIQRSHMNDRMWIQIGYHFIVGPNGEVFQGRQINETGSHVANNNTGNVGIMLIGNFEIETPTEFQLQATRDVILLIHSVYPHMDLPRQIYAHREFRYTDCPGRNLFQFVLDLKYGKEKF